MKARLWLSVVAICVVSLGRVARPAEPAERMFDYGPPFGTIALYMPAQKPTGVVIFLSGDGGWHLGVVDMARHLAERGAAVAGLDVRRYLGDIAANRSGSCRYMAADLETLSHRVQREMGLDEYHAPLIYGYSSGATIAYATLVQSPPGTFSGAVSLGFCPDQKFGGAPLCAGTGAGLHYHAGPKGEWIFDPAPALVDRWVAFQGDVDSVCASSTTVAFVSGVGGAEVVSLPGVGHGYGKESAWLPQFQATYERLTKQTAPPAVKAPEVADLPLIEQPSEGSAAAPLVLLLTGDGGWAGLDRGVAAAFNQRGLPVVALSTLKYYWHARTPADSATDVARVLRHYLVQWHRERVLLVGYSFGADVLPFIVNRLPEDLRRRIVSVNMLGLEANASFEIHAIGWLPGTDSGDLPVKPELDRMQGVDALCLYGEGETHDPCLTMAGGSLRAQGVAGGHHFDGNYEALAAAMLGHAGAAAGAETPVR